ncbi:hypothetical protein HYT23_06955 [Candidatus Pacearchaeota archaeon]|nr:hypothetical protein [Candidatus Pacearchaeota archaeon]
MENEFKCEICGTIFQSHESLNQHTSAKHKELIKSERKPLNTKKIRNWIIFILVFVGFIWLVVYGISGTIKEDEFCASQSAAEMNIGSHTNLKNHIHQELEILIDGERQLIPSEIGISPGIMRPIHTHDSSGEVHVEGPCKRDFTLGDFFDVWVKEFDSTKIFDKTTQNGSLKMSVNGQESTEFRNLILKDHDRIKIEYISNK